MQALVCLDPVPEILLTELEQCAKTQVTCKTHLIVVNTVVTVPSLFIVPDRGYTPVQSPNTGAGAPPHFSTGYAWASFASKVMLGWEELQGLEQLSPQIARQWWLDGGINNQYFFLQSLFENKSLGWRG